MNARRFTVQESMVSRVGTELRFRGRWLESMGFHAGQTVEVSNPQHGLILVRVSESVPVTSGFNEALAALDKALPVAS